MLDVSLSLAAAPCIMVLIGLKQTIFATYGYFGLGIWMLLQRQNHVQACWLRVARVPQA